MAADAPTPLDVQSAGAFFEAGPRDIGSASGRRVMVVDLDSPGDPAPLRPSSLLPFVTIGISAGASPDAPPLDVLVTAASHPPAPWVPVGDLETAVAGLSEIVDSHPLAAVMLMQVLRGGGTDLDRDLTLESLAYSTLQAGPEHATWLAPRTPRTRPAEAGPVVETQRDGDALRITLNRPHVRNAYNAAMRDALCEALTVAVLDGRVSVDLFGAGADFCSGGDLDEFGSRPDPATAHLIRTERSAARLLASVADRATAHLHGACVGAGIEIPALAARVTAAPDTVVRLPEVAMGLLPGAGGTASLPRRIGRGRTAWLALTGQAIDAGTALRWGLVDHISDG